MSVLPSLLAHVLVFSTSKMLNKTCLTNVLRLNAFPKYNTLVTISEKDMWGHLGGSVG